ncbi:MAG: hypothetical protein ABJL54_02635 [Halioglobus sp.]
MLFHAGVLLRLSELGLLKDREHTGGVGAVSSVSGGSMTSAAAALHWQDLSAGRTESFLVAIQRLANHTLIDPEKLAKGLIEGGVNRYITDRLESLELQGQYTYFL